MLRRIGASAGIGSLSGTAQANQSKTTFTIEEKKELVDKYADADAVRKAVKEHGEDVLNALNDRGYTSFSDSTGLDVSSYREDDYLELAPEVPTRGFGVSAYNKGGTLTAHIMVSQHNSEYNYGIYVQPEVERAYAIVSVGKDEGKVLVDPAASQPPTNDSTCPDCDESILCEEEYRCGSLCDSNCVPQSTSCCDYQAIRDAQFHNPITDDCCCTRTEVVECGTHHNEDWETVISCTDCYDTANATPCC